VIKGGRGLKGICPIKNFQNPPLPINHAELYIIILINKKNM
jgi:hypothetical protein